MRSEDSDMQNITTQLAPTKLRQIMSQRIHISRGIFGSLFPLVPDGRDENESFCPRSDISIVISAKSEDSFLTGSIPIHRNSGICLGAVSVIALGYVFTVEISSREAGHFF